MPVVAAASSPQEGVVAHEDVRRRLADVEQGISLGWCVVPEEGALCGGSALLRERSADSVTWERRLTLRRGRLTLLDPRVTWGRGRGSAFLNLRVALGRGRRRGRRARLASDATDDEVRPKVGRFLRATFEGVALPVTTWDLGFERYFFARAEVRRGLAEEDLRFEAAVWVFVTRDPDPRFLATGIGELDPPRIARENFPLENRSRRSRRAISSDRSRTPRSICRWRRKWL